MEGIFFSFKMRESEICLQAEKKKSAEKESLKPQERLVFFYPFLKIEFVGVTLVNKIA